jgi:hypothetical protein
MKDEKKILIYSDKGAFEDWNYEMSANEIHWESKAFQLKKACDILFYATSYEFEEFRKAVNEKRWSELKHEVNILDQAIMLASFSIENLMKGIYVSKFPEAITQGKIPDDIGKTHNLNILAEKVSMVLDEDEKRLCDHLTEWAVNHGRYPIGKKTSDLKSRRKINLGVKHPIDELFSKVLHELYASSKILKGKLKPQ